MADTDSILDTTKKLLGLDPADTSFDLDVVTHINSVFFTLQQLGVGPSSGFMITGKESTWGEFIGSDYIQAVKSYMGIRVRLLFDPPTTSFALDALNKQAEQMEWRLNVAAENAAAAAWLTTSSAYIYEIDGNTGFPTEANPGDIGVDPNSGDVWRVY